MQCVINIRKTVSHWCTTALHFASAPSLAVFRQRLKTFLFSRSYQNTIILTRVLPLPFITSGAGTNLKVGGTSTARKWGKGTPVRHEAPEKFVGRAPLLFGSISRFGERFRDGKYSLVSFVFAVFLLTVPPCPANPFVKVGARAPRALWSRRHCMCNRCLKYA